MNEWRRQTLQRVSAVLRRWEDFLEADLRQEARELLAMLDGALTSDAPADGADYELVRRRIERFLTLLTGTTRRRAS